MTRNEAKQKLIDLGIEEPTEEQVTNYLNTIGEETKKEKDRADKLKEKADRADELEQQLEQQQNADKTDLQKAQDRIAELEKANAIAAQKKSAMEQFKINAEQADKVIKADGTLDYSALGQIISEKETAAATAKEQEIASKAGNPGGGTGGGGGDDTRTNAEKIASRVFNAPDDKGNTVISHYLGGN